MMVSHFQSHAPAVKCDKPWARLLCLFTFHLSLFICLLGAVASCEQNFEPWQENDRYFFSIYGYLDASADTQWVRVMPIRDGLFPGPEPINTTVMLEHLESGEKTIMNDSLFDLGQNRYVWNFWTTMPLRPAQTYRLTVENSEGNISHVAVTLPRDYPAPVVWIFGGSSLIRISEVENLGDVRSVYEVIHPGTGVERIYSVPNIQNANFTLNGHQVAIHEFQDELFIRRRLGWFLELDITPMQIFVAAAGPEWVDFSTLSDDIITLPDGISNIENGVGYLVGMVSKTVPFRSCFDEFEDPVACPTEKPLR